MTAAILDVDENDGFQSSQSAKPAPMSSLTASAKRITSKTFTRARQGRDSAWQADAWDMYDLNGELRYLSNTLAGRMAQARLFVGQMPDDPTESIVEVTDGDPYDVFTILGHKARILAELIVKAGINLFVPGECYLIGVPPQDVQEAEARANGEGGASQTIRNSEDGITPYGAPWDATDSDDGQFDPFAMGIDDLKRFVWRVYSANEVKVENNICEIVGEGGTLQQYHLDRIMMIRVWRPHPRRWWQADSPTRSSLPVLRELVGLTMHVSSQVDSRLAGAGMLLIPESADRAVRAAAGLPEEGEDESPFVQALMDAMVSAIQDRSSASALVPIMPVVPDDSIEKFKFISFATPLDSEAKNLRDEAIRRLSLGLDCPPELLLGTSQMNHWGAWLVREDVVTTHIEPPLALLCDALTTQFLWPILEQMGMPEADYTRYVIWFDVNHLIIRPNRVKDAYALHGVGAIGDEPLRDAAGFDEDDAPTFAKIAKDDPVHSLAISLVRQNPNLLYQPGLAVIVEQLQAMMDGKEIPAIEAPAAPSGAGPAGAAGRPTNPKEPSGGIPVNEDKDTSDDQPANGQNAAIHAAYDEATKEFA